MGVAVEKLKHEFIQNIQSLEEKYLEECMKELMTQQEEIVVQAKDSMMDCLVRLCEQYNALQTQGQTGNLRYLYISFLRTSILQKTAWYRIDAYDSRDRASIIECGISWDFTGAAALLQPGVEILRQEFKKQSYVREYELDFFIYQIADRIRQEVETLIPGMLSHVMSETGERLFGENSVDMMLGEYLDQARWIAGWRQGREISAAEYEQAREGEEYV